ncbi:MAG: thioredoxin family protein [Hellea sp.]|nr:thioredoxin family protein [Hellea sp.]
MSRYLLSLVLFLCPAVASCSETPPEEGAAAPVQEVVVPSSLEDRFSKTAEEISHSPLPYAHAEDGEHHDEDEPRPYDADADAHQDVEDILARARANDKLAIIAMGANWCHDSRGLAARFEDPDFRAQNITPYYELLYIDVGRKDRNIDIAQRFGVEEIVGTPTVFIVTSEGEVLNLDTAPTWRNAASRTDQETADYFREFASQDQ